MLKRIKSFFFYLLREDGRIENKNPYGLGLLKGYKEYYGDRDEREY